MLGTSRDPPSAHRPTMTLVYVHGGVSGLPKTPADIAHALSGCAELPPLEAVERAVTALEDDPALNAGYGAVLNRAGEVELDAGIAQGSSGEVGAVACVNVKNPIRLARVVLETTPHLLLAGRGAEQLAEERGLARLEDTTSEQRRRWSAARDAGELVPGAYAQPEHVDTVGAVAVDKTGHVSAGSSTGGVFGKLPGRVGDSPVFGAGFYASPLVAVVGTGVGEVFLQNLACLRVAQLTEDGASVQKACESIVAKLASTGAAAAGLLAVDSEGHLGAAYCGGSWGVWGPDGQVTAAKVRT